MTNDYTIENLTISPFPQFEQLSKYRVKRRWEICFQSTVELDILQKFSPIALSEVKINDFSDPIDKTKFEINLSKKNNNSVFVDVVSINNEYCFIILFFRYLYELEKESGYVIKNIESLPKTSWRIWKNITK